MALQVWLPLNGNLDNQGLSSLQPVQTTAPTYVNGKLGKAMSTGAFYLPATEVAKFYNNNAMSWTFWIYPTTSGSVATPIIGQSNTGAGDCRMFTIFQYPNGVDLHLSWQTEAGGNAFLASILSNAFTVNTWNHCAITYDGSTIRIYINGDIKATYTNRTSNRTNFNYNVPIPNSSSRYLSDVRIYDHCLSPKEVELISRGLVVHYPMNGSGAAQANLVPNLSAYHSLDTALTRTSSAKDGWYFVPNSHFIVEPSTTYTYSVCCDGNLASQHRAAADPSDKSFTMWLYLCNSDTTKDYEHGGYDSPIDFNSSNYNHQQIGNRHIWQYTTTSTQTHMSIRINTYSNGTDATTVKFWQIKVEKGSIASPWIPNINDSQYNSLGYNSTTEYDVSGNGYNGIKSANIIYESDSLRYLVSTHFTASSNTNITLPAMILDMTKFSVSAWFKLDSAQAWSRILDLGEKTSGTGYSFLITTNSNGLVLTVAGRGPGGASLPDTSVQSVSLNTWYHVVTTIDNTTCKTYVNGLLVKTFTMNQPFSSTTPMNLNYIGKSNWTQDKYLDGNISDFRLYATVLTEDQIKELYQTSASIDKNGNMYAYEYNEI